MSVQAGSRGFTIFELMITVAIAAVIAAFAVPSFRDLMSRNRVNAVTEEVVNSLAAARNAAITRRRTVIVLVTSSGNWEVRLDSNTGTLLEGHSFTAPVSVAWPATNLELSIAPSGMVKQKVPVIATVPVSWTVRLCDSGSRTEIGKTVVITKLGRLRKVSDPDASACNP